MPADPEPPGAPAPQSIPRPAEWRPGAPAPWAALPAPARAGLTLERVLGALSEAGQLGPVPARTDGDEMFRPWVRVPDAGAAVTSAVLVALFEEGGETRVVLTRRSADLRSHRGEVSFPGGRLDPGEGVLGAALREAEEEVELDPALVTPVGWLHPVLTFASGSLVMPVVSTLPARPAVRANPAEVARVFDVALAELTADGAFHEERWRHPGRPPLDTPDGAFPVWFFEAAGETIWGATARMLYELVSRALLGARGA